MNCAGIGPSERILGKKGVHDLDLYATVMKVNLIGTFNVLALAAEQIAETDADEQGQRGVVVNTASIAAYDGQVGQAAYSSSKGGIVGLTSPAARDLAQYGIRVNTIAPGIVETPMLATVSDEFRAGLAAGGAVPAAARPPRGVRPARAGDHRPRLPQRRGHPDGRRPAHGAALTHATHDEGVPLARATPSRCRRRVGPVSRCTSLRCISRVWRRRPGAARCRQHRAR